MPSCIYKDVINLILRFPIRKCLRCDVVTLYVNN